MKIIRYNDTSSDKGTYITLKEAYEICCLKHDNGFEPSMMGKSFAEFLKILMEAEKECFLHDRDDGVYINVDSIQYSHS